MFLNIYLKTFFLKLHLISSILLKSNLLRTRKKSPVHPQFRTQIPSSVQTFILESLESSIILFNKCLKMTEEKIGSLEEEALKRKERLQALKRKNEEGKENASDIAENLPK